MGQKSGKITFEHADQASNRPSKEATNGCPALNTAEVAKGNADLDVPHIDDMPEVDGESGNVTDLRYSRNADDERNGGLVSPGSDGDAVGVTESTTKKKRESKKEKKKKPFRFVSRRLSRKNTDDHKAEGSDDKENVPKPPSETPKTADTKENVVVEDVKISLGESGDAPAVDPQASVTSSHAPVAIAADDLQSSEAEAVDLEENVPKPPSETPKTADTKEKVVVEDVKISLEKSADAPAVDPPATVTRSHAPVAIAADDLQSPEAEAVDLEKSQAKPPLDLTYPADLPKPKPPLDLPYPANLPKPKRPLDLPYPANLPKPKPRVEIVYMPSSSDLCSDGDEEYVPVDTNNTNVHADKIMICEEETFPNLHERAGNQVSEKAEEQGDDDVKEQVDEYAMNRSDEEASDKEHETEAVNGVHGEGETAVVGSKKSFPTDTGGVELTNGSNHEVDLSSIDHEKELSCEPVA